MTSSSNARIMDQVSELTEQTWTRLAIGVILLVLGGLPLLLVGNSIPAGPDGLGMTFLFIALVPIAAIFGIISLIMLILGFISLGERNALRRTLAPVKE